MIKGVHQKLKLLYLAKLFMTMTDEEHGLTVAEISEHLKNYDVSADRKTLYQDFEQLRYFGLDIISSREKGNCIYRLASREFELPELKLLVDCVQSAKFITENKSNELIKKLESLASVHEAKQLHRSVYISGRVKTMNESIYRNIDIIQTAIIENKQIRFQYFQWNIKKEPVLRHDGAWYIVSPWSLTWDDENYYLFAYDAHDKIIKHYRVDKMIHISATENSRDGQQIYSESNLPLYSKRLFGMYSGEQVKATLLCENSMVGTMIDRFGKDIMVIKEDEEHCTVSVDVAESDHFLAWIIALGTGVKIVAPTSLIEKMKEKIEKLNEQYS